ETDSNETSQAYKGVIEYAFINKLFPFLMHDGKMNKQNSNEIAVNATTSETTTTTDPASSTTEIRQSIVTEITTRTENEPSSTMNSEASSNANDQSKTAQMTVSEILEDSSSPIGGSTTVGISQTTLEQATDLSSESASKEVEENHSSDGLNRVTGLESTTNFDDLLSSDINQELTTVDEVSFNSEQTSKSFNKGTSQTEVSVRTSFDYITPSDYPATSIPTNEHFGTTEGFSNFQSTESATHKHPETDVFTDNGRRIDTIEIDYQITLQQEQITPEFVSEVVTSSDQVQTSFNEKSIRVTSQGIESPTDGEVSSSLTTENGHIFTNELELLNPIHKPTSQQTTPLGSTVRFHLTEYSTPPSSNQITDRTQASIVSNIDESRTTTEVITTENVESLQERIIQTTAVQLPDGTKSDNSTTVITDKTILPNVKKTDSPNTDTNQEFSTRSSTSTITVQLQEETNRNDYPPKTLAPQISTETFKEFPGSSTALRTLKSNIKNESFSTQSDLQLATSTSSADAGISSSRDSSTQSNRRILTEYEVNPKSTTHIDNNPTIYLTSTQLVGKSSSLEQAMSSTPAMPNLLEPILTSPESVTKLDHFSTKFETQTSTKGTTGSKTIISNDEISTSPKILMQPTDDLILTEQKIRATTEIPKSLQTTLKSFTTPSKLVSETSHSTHPPVTQTDSFTGTAKMIFTSTHPKEIHVPSGISQESTKVAEISTASIQRSTVVPNLTESTSNAYLEQSSEDVHRSTESVSKLSTAVPKLPNTSIHSSRPSTASKIPALPTARNSEMTISDTHQRHLPKSLTTESISTTSKPIGTSTRAHRLHIDPSEENSPLSSTNVHHTSMDLPSTVLADNPPTSTQCPCLGNILSGCLPYDSRLQAMTLEEAMIAFPDLTRSQNIVQPTTIEDEIACTTKECIDCQKDMRKKLAEVGLLPNAIDIAMHAQGNYTNCKKYGFSSGDKKKKDKKKKDSHESSESKEEKEDHKRKNKDEDKKKKQKQKQKDKSSEKKDKSEERDRKKKKHKRQTLADGVTDPNIIGTRYTMSCTQKGVATDSSGFVPLCSSCWVWRKLPDNYSPQYINELVCDNSDGSCLSG
ncbi:hypothetical protein WR25_19464, partial [Diploscapter pachys]